MADYLAWQMEEGKLDYLTMFSKEFFKQYKADTDAILIKDGYEHLIVPIT